VHYVVLAGVKAIMPVSQFLLNGLTFMVNLNALFPKSKLSEITLEVGL
jgi:hypothetical protein